MGLRVLGGDGGFALFLKPVFILFIFSHGKMFREDQCHSIALHELKNCPSSFPKMEQ